MPKGKHLSKDQKERMYRCLILQQKSPEECFEEVFYSNSNMMSLRYIIDKKKWFEDHADNEIIIAEYIHKTNKRGGAKRILSVEDDKIISTLSIMQPKRSYERVAKEFSVVSGTDVLSRDTMRRSNKRSKIGEKVVTSESAFLDHNERAQTLQLLAPYSIEQMHNFDESVAAMKKFNGKRARATFGEPAIWTDWYLPVGNRIYSVIADYTSKGWSIWRIFWSNLNHLSVETFLREDLSSVLTDGSVILSDGASVHLTPTTQQLLHQITRGHYVKVAAFSHDLSPVERGFSNVWRYIRSNWDPRNGQTPEQLIDEAFFRYSIAGPMGHVAKGHWNIYNRNHENFQFNTNN